MSIADRKQREKEARRNLIIDRASTLFYKKGYSNTSLGEIAEALDISKATIYLHFKSKDDLYYQIVEPALHELSQRLARIDEEIDEPADIAIRKIFDTAFEVFSKDPGAYHVLCRYNATEFIKLLPKTRLDDLKDFMRINLNRIVRAISRGISQGRFANVDAKRIAIVIWTCFMGVLQFEENRKEEGKTDYRKATIGEAIDLFLNGLKKQ
jgi:TetR/AcrR family transcriptional regulator